MIIPKGEIVHFDILNDFLEVWEVLSGKEAFGTAYEKEGSLYITLEIDDEKVEEQLCEVLENYFSILKVKKGVLRFRKILYYTLSDFSSLKEMEKYLCSQS